MIKLIPMISQTKDGDVDKRMSGKQQHSAIRSAIKKIPHDELTINYNHFVTSGFIKRGDDIVYFSTGDYRFWNDSAYVRYAKSFNDYIGGWNEHTTITKLDIVIENLLS